MNTLNKQSRAADKGWFSNFRWGVGGRQVVIYVSSMSRNVTKGLGLKIKCTQILIRQPEGKVPTVIPGCEWGNNVKWMLKKSDVMTQIGFS
jgi:hypothetical protein